MKRDQKTGEMAMDVREKETALRDHYGCHAFQILTVALILEEIMAMAWNWTDSFPRVLSAICLAVGYYLIRSIWAGVYFRPGQSPAPTALALSVGVVMGGWRLIESFTASAQVGWSFRIAWAMILCFCLAVLLTMGLKLLRNRRQ